MKLSYISLGCAKNQVDFEYLIGALSKDGFEAERDPSVCDAVIINTCGFIEPAVQEAINTILTMKETIPQHAKLIVTGCMSERYKDDILSELPEIDFVTGVGKLEDAAEYLRKLFAVKAKKHDKIERIIVNHPYYAYVKISEGCNNRCSYCTIPSIRGGLKSRPKEDIISEVRFLTERGVKEIVVISQDTTKYSKDLTGTFEIVPLVSELSEIFTETSFRLLYLNPDGVTDELIDLAAARENIVKYFEIPVQHASDNVLKAMNRHSDYKKITEIFTKIRAKVPDAFIRTTFIIGFPNETEEDFNAVYRFIEEYKPDFVGFFPYYQEEGTKAAEMESILDKKTTDARIKKLQTLQKKITTARLKKYMRKEFLCYAEEVNEDFDFIAQGRAVFQAPETDGKVYIVDGVASRGAGPYRCIAEKVVYPDIYVKLIEEQGDK